MADGARRAGAKEEGVGGAAAGQGAFEEIGGADDSGLLLLCDHASNALPEGYGTLGLPAAQLARHIGYDIGAAAVTRRIAALLGAPALLTTFSRLLIDPNRGLDDPTLVMRLSDGAIVPGNARIDADEIERRVERYWRPYRDAVGRALERMSAGGSTPVVISVHSFTPSWKGVPRPWEIGVLWDSDARLAVPLMDALRDAGFHVGDNARRRHAGRGGDAPRHRRPAGRSAPGPDRQRGGGLLDRRPPRRRPRPGDQATRAAQAGRAALAHRALPRVTAASS